MENRYLVRFWPHQNYLGYRAQNKSNIGRSHSKGLLRGTKSNFPAPSGLSQGIIARMRDRRSPQDQLCEGFAPRSPEMGPGRYQASTHVSPEGDHVAQLEQGEAAAIEIPPAEEKFPSSAQNHPSDRRKVSFSAQINGSSSKNHLHYRYFWR